MLSRMGRRMSSWLSAQIILSVIIGVATFIGLLILRIPYALPLAIALLHSHWQFWSVLIFAIVLQKVENLLIVPRVMSRKVSISPLAVFIAFMIGASLLGLIGAIIAIPVAAIVQVAFEEVFIKRRERRLDLDRAGTLMRKAD